MAETKKSIRGLMIFGLIMVILLGFTLGLYLAGVKHFKTRFLPNTKIGNISCGNQVPAYVTDRNQKDAEDYLITIYAKDGSKVNLVGKDFDYCYVSYGEEEEILKEQDPWRWPMAFFRDSTYELPRKAVYNRPKLNALIAELDIIAGEDVADPKNAYVRLTQEGYEVVPEEQGTRLDLAMVQELVAESALDMASSVTITDECYLKPEITSDDPSIIAFSNEIEGYLSATIHYEIDGVDENLTRRDIAKLLTITNDGNLKIDDAKLTSYVQSLATKYNTYGDKRQFVTTQGDTITIGGGDYGWVIDKSKEKATILENLKDGQPVSREPVYEQRAQKSGIDDIGDTYVELDYTNQHFWYYIKGELYLESDLVSGNLSTRNGSVDGVYKIVYKKKDAQLVGEDYSSSVKYFMPFAYNIGFHDASWRSSFGGTIYRTSGSHGCINLPEEVAEKLYNKIEVGTPVIAYYRETVELTNNAAKQSNAYSYKK